MTQKLHGKIEYLKPEKKWRIRTEPHIVLRLKRMFERIKKEESSVVTISDTIETCADLEWFISRYPMEMDAATRGLLRFNAKQHVDHLEKMELIVREDYAPRVFQGMKIEPRSYQKIAAEWYLRQKFILLGDTVGLGKTISFITSFTDPRVLPAVVVTHTFLQIQWKAEIERCLPDLYVHIIEQCANYAIPKRNGRTPDVILISYSKIAHWCRWIANYCNSAVYDECQELRHSGTQKYDAAKIITDGVEFRGGASATPIFGYGGEMYNVLNIINPGGLGEKDEFVREWCTGEDNKIKIKHPNAFGTYLRENFVMLRRTREDVGREIPMVQKIPYAIDSDQKEFKKIEKDAVLLAQTMLDRSCNMMKRRNAGGQLNSIVRQATGVAKALFVAHFVSMLLESVDQVVLFGWHIEVYARWVRHFETAGIPYAKFTGEETPQVKEAAKTRFINRDARVLIMSLRSGAGVDGFQHICNTCVFGELDYSPAVHEQATGRIARDGQTEPVNAYYLVSNQGSDPIMSEVLGVKKAQLDGINSPDRDVIENMQLDGDHIKRLAQQYLLKAQHSLT